MLDQSNLAWDTLLELGDRSQGPLHARLTRAIRDAIRSGRVPAGSLLPPSRLLAETLGCSRWAVTEAYDQLVAEGYLEARVGSGTRVLPRAEHAEIARPRQPGGAGPYTIDLAPGLPDLRAFPRERWVAALRAVAASAPYTALGYPEPGGESRLRDLLAAYLGRVRGAQVDPANLTITTGVTDGIVRACRALAAAGFTAVAVEDPGWTKLRTAIARAGMQVVAVPVDGGGVCVDELVRLTEAAGPGTRVGAVVVSPAHQFPIGSVLGPERRVALLRWAASTDALVLEDDYDAEFRYDRRPVGTLQGADPSRVALLGSLSKTLSPALGIGWIATPPRFTMALRATEVRVAEPPVLDQLAFATFLESGGYDRHLRAGRTRYRARRDALVRALSERLPDCRVSGVAAGLHLLLHVGDGVDTAAVVERAAGRGLDVARVESYTVRNAAVGPALVLGYGDLADHEIGAAVAALERAVRGA